MKGWNWTVAAFIVTAIALIVGFIGLAINSVHDRDIVAALERLENHDQEISNNMKSVSATLERLGSRLERLESRDKEISLVLENLLEITEPTRVITSLNSKGWPSYLARVKNAAVDHKPRYLGPWEGQKVLTAEGRQLLDSELINEIDGMVKGKQKFQENDVILDLDVHSLYHKARKQNVSLDIMVAVVASYIHEVQKGD